MDQLSNIHRLKVTHQPLSMHTLSCYSYCLYCLHCIYYLECLHCFTALLFTLFNSLLHCMFFQSLHIYIAHFLICLNILQGCLHTRDRFGQTLLLNTLYIYICIVVCHTISCLLHNVSTVEPELRHFVSL